MNETSPEEYERRWRAQAQALHAEVEWLRARIAAGLIVADDLDSDPEWAARQIRTALLTGVVTNGAPDATEQVG